MITKAYCEICGKASVKALVQIEGAKMMTCGNCGRGGKVIQIFENEERAKEAVNDSTVRENKPAFDSGEEVVENFASIIKNARERMSIPTATLAERIKETESYLHAMENGRVNPSIGVAKKLEKELNVKLVEKITKEVNPTIVTTKKFSEPTLADLLEAQMKKN
jgi:putative transcription factor